MLGSAKHLQEIKDKRREIEKKMRLARMDARGLTKDQAMSVGAANNYNTKKAVMMTF